MKKKIKINFTDFPNGLIKENNLFTNLLRQRFDVEISDKPDFLFYSVFGLDFLDYDCVRIFYTGENARPNFNDCDYAFTYDRLDYYGKNHRLPFWLEFDTTALTKPKDVEKLFTEKQKFCNFVYSNPGAKERNTFYKLLEQYKHIDSGGRAMNNIGGPVQDKIGFQRGYKFSIAFENSSFPGYSTEKIVHAFLANTIPIYWGDPEITKDFNPKAFINCHDFPSFEAVVERVKEIDNDPELFKQYLAEPSFVNNELPQELTEKALLDRFEYIFSTPIEPVARNYILSRFATARVKKYLWFIKFLRGGILYLPRKLFLFIDWLLHAKKRKAIKFI